MASDRYTRQIRLAELGERGQEALLQSRVRTGVGEGAVVEVMYLHRAGVARVELDSMQRVERFPHAAAFRHGAARAVAAGAWRALSHVRSVLGFGAT